MSSQYKSAPEVEEIARDLIYDFHSHLVAARIEYVFIGKPATNRGLEVWGRARKVTGLNAWLSTPSYSQEKLKEPEEFFVLEIAEPIWKALDAKARRALVDHELTHFDVNEDGKLKLRPHDLEEFTIIVRRHGLWRPEIEFFVEAGQEKLPGFDATSPDDVAERGCDQITMIIGDREYDITDEIKGARKRREATA